MIWIDLLFPRRCPVCDRALPIGALICTSCADKLKIVKPPFCRKCGKGLVDEREEYCADCMQTQHFYTEGRALYEYPCVRRSMYRFKYKGRREYAEFYGGELARLLGDVIRRWNPDALVPVPLHRTRRRTRGYNQAQALADVLGRQLGIRVESGLLRRVKKTVPQKCLNREMRQNNLKKAFKLCRNDVKLNTIIVIDDIYTTGSTIDAAAAVLREAGIKEVYFIALAAGISLENASKRQ
ncbi:MAG: ComF family protein [Lachnospiraceae bacterium]|nr:ComF family protein [Lachnospiraceae bacterium]